MSQHYERGSNNAHILAKPQREIQRPIRYKTEAVVNITFSLFLIPSLSRCGKRLGLGPFGVVCIGTWQCEMWLSKEWELLVFLPSVPHSLSSISLSSFCFISHIHPEHLTEPELPQLSLSFCRLQGISKSICLYSGIILSFLVGFRYTFVLTMFVHMRVYFTTVRHLAASTHVPLNHSYWFVFR